MRKRGDGPSSLCKRCFLLLLVAGRLASIFSFSGRAPTKHFSFLSESKSPRGTGDEPTDEPPFPSVEVSNARIDDGGSNLTDRFKYKVNALMGVFDPPDAAADTENENGNILNAMLKFPVEYAFNAVGRTSGDPQIQQYFVDQVKEVVMSRTGETEERLATRVTPRGSRFTKVTIQAEVQSASMIAKIYEELSELELCVMQF